MDSDELRRACKRLGWKHGPYAEYVTEPHPSGQMLNGKPAVRFWQLDDYALPAYVASLLVAMVRERGDGWRYYTTLMLEIDALATNCLDIASLATDEQRIRAAMEVLGDEV